MTLIDMVLTAGFVLGLLIAFCSVTITNLAVQRMRVVLNSERAEGDQLSWSDAIQKVAQSVIDEYRKRYPQAPLYRNLVFGYYMLGIGTIVALGSAFMLKFVK